MRDWLWLKNGYRCLVPLTDIEGTLWYCDNDLSTSYNYYSFKWYANLFFIYFSYSIFWIHFLSVEEKQFALVFLFKKKKFLDHTPFFFYLGTTSYNFLFARLSLSVCINFNIVLLNRYVFLILVLNYVERLCLPLKSIILYKLRATNQIYADSYIVKRNISSEIVRLDFFYYRHLVVSYKLIFF